jgi:flavin-binding protein dodecin
MCPLYVGSIGIPRVRPLGPRILLGGPLSNRTYRVTEIVGTSPEGIDQAIRNGIARAARTLRHVDWFEVTQVRGQVKDGDVEHFQVGMKVGFRLEDD